jgi:hypothetical protein
MLLECVRSSQVVKLQNSTNWQRVLGRSKNNSCGCGSSLTRRWQRRVLSQKKIFLFNFAALRLQAVDGRTYQAAGSSTPQARPRGLDRTFLRLAGCLQNESPGFSESSRAQQRFKEFFRD